MKTSSSHYSFILLNQFSISFLHSKRNPDSLFGRMSPSRVLAYLLLFLAPSSLVSAGNFPFQRRTTTSTVLTSLSIAITPDDLRLNTLYAQYAAAAYCNANNNNQINSNPRLNCSGAVKNNGGQSNCLAVESAGANAAFKFSNK
jgi:hypothetical protein